MSTHRKGAACRTEAGCVLCQPGAGGAGKRPPHTADGVSKARVAAQPSVGGGGAPPSPDAAGQRGWAGQASGFCRLGDRRPVIF